MLDTGALSPEVKKLFVSIAKQAEEYNKAFKKIDNAVSDFGEQRDRMNADLERIRTEISDSIKSLDQHARDTVDEFREKTEVTHSLFQELDKVDKLKLELYDLRDEIKSQSMDLSTSLVDFNTRADRELAATISLIRKKLDNTLDEEIGKIESKVARRIAAFEKNQKVFESRIRGIDANIRGDVRKLAGEIDYAYNSITEIKADVANYFKPLIEKVDLLENEVPRISNLLDNVAAKVKDRLGTISDQKYVPEEGAAPAPAAGDDSEAVHMEPTTPESYDAGEGNYDDSAFDFDEGGYATPDDLKETPTDDIRKMSDKQFREHMEEEISNIEEKALQEMRKGTISIILSIVSLLGLLVVLFVTVL